MILYFEGSCVPNPGAMEFSIVSKCGTIKVHSGHGMGTMAEAEWQALLLATEKALEHHGPVLIMGNDDSTAVKQALGIWACSKPHLKVFFDRYHEMIKSSDIVLHSILRKQNPAVAWMSEQRKKRKKALQRNNRKWAR